MELTTKQRHRLLARLANFLEDLPHSKFYLPTWCSKDATKHSCGTAGCIAGWAATIYQKHGWSFCPSLTDSDYRYPVFRGRAGAFGMATFFGISDDQAVTLTSGSFVPKDQCDITPQDAADAIRRLLRHIDPSALIEVGDTVEATELNPVA